MRSEDLIQAGNLTAVMRKLRPEALSNLRHLPVGLTASGFEASGAILATDAANQRFFVATAKHNLLLAGGAAGTKKKVPKIGGNSQSADFRADSRKIIDYCKSDMKVVYFTAATTGADVTLATSGGGANAAEGTVTDVWFPEGAITADTWAYDACLLIVSYTTAPFATGRDWARRTTWVGPTKTTLEGYHGPGGGLRSQGTDAWQDCLVQLGFGRRDHSPMSKGNGRRQEKLSRFKARNAHVPIDVINVQNDDTVRNDDVFLLESTTDWTTLPGDSGGPLYVVNPSLKIPVQIGVTLGADGSATKNATYDLATDGTYNNTVTSLLRLYTALETSPPA